MSWPAVGRIKRPPAPKSGRTALLHRWKAGVAPRLSRSTQLDSPGAAASRTARPPEYRDCVDVDLSFTPATNTLPIRRLDLDVGKEAEVHVAWLVWPELSVQRVDQRYARIANDRYRYTQDDFEAELTIDEQGLVLEYEGLWRAIASA